MDDKLPSFEVTDRQTFIQFLELFQGDLAKNPGDWENNTLSSFVEAMAAYTSDIQGFYDNTNQNINADLPSWKVFADILRGARIYE